MNRTFGARLTTASASIEGGLFGLIREMAPECFSSSLRFS